MIVCPECGGKKLLVTHGYCAGEAGLTRSRKCVTCGCRFTTVEMPLGRASLHKDGAFQVARLIREGKLQVEVKRVDPDD